MRLSTAPGRDAAVFSTPASSVAPTPRLTLSLLTLLAVVAAGLVAAQAPASGIEPDLVRVIRCMALIKGGFAAMALAASWWRLARPVNGWRACAYVTGPALMAGGAVALWSLQGVGAAALGLHLGLFGMLAAGLTDPAFFDGWRRRA